MPQERLCRRPGRFQSWALPPGCCSTEASCRVSWGPSDSTERVRTSSAAVTRPTVTSTPTTPPESSGVMACGPRRLGGAAFAMSDQGRAHQARTRDRGGEGCDGLSWAACREALTIRRAIWGRRRPPGVGLVSPATPWSRAVLGVFAVVVPSTIGRPSPAANTRESVAAIWSRSATGRVLLSDGVL